MPTYTIFNQQIKAPTPDLACLAFAKQHEKALHRTRSTIAREWKKSHAYSMSLQSYIDAQYIPLNARTFYPIRNFNILQESIEES